MPKTWNRKKSTAKQLLNHGCVYQDNGSKCQQLLHPLLRIPTPCAPPRTPGGRGGQQGTWAPLFFPVPFSPPPPPRPSSGSLLTALPTSWLWMWRVSSGLWGRNSQRELRGSGPWTPRSGQTQGDDPTQGSFLHLLEQHLSRAELRKEVGGEAQVPRWLYLSPSSLFLPSFCFTAPGRVLFYVQFSGKHTQPLPSHLKPWAFRTPSVFGHCCLCTVYGCRLLFTTLSPVYKVTEAQRNFTRVFLSLYAHKPASNNTVAKAHLVTIISIFCSHGGTPVRSVSVRSHHRRGSRHKNLTQLHEPAGRGVVPTAQKPPLPPGPLREVPLPACIVNTQHVQKIQTTWSFQGTGFPNPALAQFHLAVT